MALGRDNCLSRAVTKRTGFVISRGHDLGRRGDVARPGATWGRTWRDVPRTWSDVP